MHQQTCRLWIYIGKEKPLHVPLLRLYMNMIVMWHVTVCVNINKVRCAARRGSMLTNCSALGMTALHEHTGRKQSP